MYILTFTFCVSLSVFDCSITSRAWMTPMEWARLDHPPNKWSNNIRKIIRLLIGDNLQKLGINLVLIFRVLPVMVEDDQPNQLLQLFNQLMKLFDQCNCLNQCYDAAYINGQPPHKNFWAKPWQMFDNQWIIIKMFNEMQTGWLYFLPALFIFQNAHSLSKVIQHTLKHDPCPYINYNLVINNLITWPSINQLHHNPW